MPAAYDHAGSLERMGHDEQLFRDMVGFLFDDGPRWWKELHEARAQHDALRLHRVAHTLKGLVANFGATRTINAAGDVEHQAKQADWDALASSLPELGSALTELMTELRAYSSADTLPLC